MVETLPLLAWLVGLEELLPPAVSIEVCPDYLGWLGGAVLGPLALLALINGGRGFAG